MLARPSFMADDPALLNIGAALLQCRFEPQMLVLVIRASTSFGRAIFASACP